MNKIILIAALFVVSILMQLTLISAEANYCCEKTLNGAWCQNSPQAQCDSGFRTAPTSCDSTSYCKRGCCFDSNEGLCMEGTSQRVCEASNGTWADNEQCDVPQCSLGCCVLADQGAFVTLTRCKQMSGFYGIRTDFRRGITDELTCIETAQGADKGACVSEDPSLLKKTCTFTTRAACRTASLSSENSLNANNSGSTTGSINASSGAAPGFYKDYLCSAEELGTMCGRSTETTVISGKDEVYYLDTCGNIANIYDSSRYNDNLYWKKIFKKSESCGYGSSNAGSTSCGNCDYYLGSIGKRSSRLLGNPVYGDYICADLACKKEGKKHGESWCVYDEPSGNGEDTVGSRYYREICINNEIITEACDDYRNQICIEDSFSGFSEAQCRVNRWQDCTKQKQESDCSNTLVRDCKWIKGYYFSEITGQIEKSIPLSEETSPEETYPSATKKTPQGLCAPNYPPGFNFWGDSQTTASTPSTSQTFNASTPGFGTGYVNPSTNTMPAATQCNLGNLKVVVAFNRITRPADWFDFFGKKEDWGCGNEACTKYVSKANEELGKISEAEVIKIAQDMNNICTTLGDCGGKNNWVGRYTDDGYAAYLLNQRLAGSGGAEVLEDTPNKNAGAATGASGTGTSSSSGSGTSASGTSASASDVAGLVNTVSSGYNAVSGGGRSGSGNVIAETPDEKTGKFTPLKVVIDYFKIKFGIGSEE